VANVQSTFDGLLVALLVALSLPEQDLPANAPADSFHQGFQQGYEGLGPGDAAACRYFADAAARQNCLSRTKRALTGAAAKAPAFPDETVWIAPNDPGMPFKIGPNMLR
jgi:hypothetical protein